MIHSASACPAPLPPGPDATDLPHALLRLAAIAGSSLSLRQVCLIYRMAAHPDAWHTLDSLRGAPPCHENQLRNDLRKLQKRGLATTAPSPLDARFHVWQLTPTALLAIG